MTAVWLAPVASAQTLYSCDQASPNLHTLDPDPGGTLTTTLITLDNGDAVGRNGLATHPGTQELWAIICANGGVRALATVDPATGNAITVGVLSTGFAGIAFDCSPNLYGVTGYHGTPAETLFRLSTVDASETQLLTLGAGNDGETIAFNPTDRLMYQASGHFDACVDDFSGRCFENIELGSLTTTNIDISTTALVDAGAQAVTWSATHNAFYWKQNHGNGPLFRVSADGTNVVNLGDMDHQTKGLVFVPTAACAAPARPTQIPAMSSVGLTALGLLEAPLGGLALIRRSS